MVFRSRCNLSARREVSIACCLTLHFWKTSLESMAQRQSMLDPPKRPEQRPHLSPDLTHRSTLQTLPVCSVSWCLSCRENAPAQADASKNANFSGVSAVSGFYARLLVWVDTVEKVLFS